MSQNSAEMISSMGNFEPFIWASILVLLAIIFVKIFFGTNTSKTNLKLPPGLSLAPNGRRNSARWNNMKTSSQQDEGSKSNPALHQFNTKIKEDYCKKNDFDPFRILEEMKSQNMSPDTTTFNTLLDICFEKDLKEVGIKLFQYLRKIQKENGKNMLDIITFNTVLKGLCLEISEKKPSEQNEISLAKVFEIMSEIRENKLKANEITFNTLIDACVKGDNIELAFKYFSEMKEYNLKPDNFTYSSLIKGIKNYHTTLEREAKDTHIKQPKHRRMGEDFNTLEKVFEIFSACKEGQITPPDEILYNCVIDACVKFKNLHKAVETYEEMVNLGLRPSHVTYGILIKGYGNEKDYEGVMGMFEKLKASTPKINDVTYGGLIDACTKCDRMDSAMNFFRVMSQDADAKISPVVYSLLIKGFTNSRNFEKAYEVYRHMLSNQNITASIITYNAMLECAIKCNNRHFFDIYEDIKQRTNDSFHPDIVTYSTYIKGLCKFNKIDEAFVLYNSLKKDSQYHLDEVLFNSLLHGLQQAKLYQKAELVYQDMKDNKIKPSPITFSILIKINSDQYKIDEALDLFQQLKQHQKPSLILYTCIIQACIRCKKISKVLDLYHDMKRSHMQCNFLFNSNPLGDEVLYNTIISGLSFNNHLIDAVNILNETFLQKKTLNHEVYFNVLRNLYKKVNARYALKGDLSQEVYEGHITQITENLSSLKIKLDPEMLEKIKLSGLDEIEGERRASDQFARKRSSFSNNYQYVHRRTMN